MRAKEFIVEGVNQVDFNKNLLTILQQKYPGTEFSIQLDRVESADGELTVIANTADQGSYVGCFMWDVSTGPYTGALGLAIKQTTDQLLQANPGKKPALFIGGDNENPKAWAHIADKLNYKLITDDDESEEGVAEDAENFNGIDISLEIQKDDEYVDDEDYDNQVIYVTASSNGRELGHVLFSIDGEYLMPQDLEVEERFRGQGIAQTMYDYVKSKGYKIRRSGQQTDAGAGFWDKHKGQGQNVWEQGVAEGSDDNGISFQIQKGKNKFATTLSIGNNPVGVYQYDAGTGRSIAEVYPEFKGKGLGKLLVLHAIYTAAQLGLNFQEDESRTAEYDNVLDSLSSNGYIVDDDGYWYVTGEGEQYLQQSMKQDMAENFADGRKFVKPNFDFEWEEAERYPEFVKLGKDAWIELARKGKAITINSAHGIDNTDAADPDSFKSLVPAKQKRALAQLKKGTVEMPIVAVYSDGHKELIGGNTRLTAMMARDGKATIWAFQVPDNIIENFADGKVKGRSRPGRVKRAGASCNGSVTDLRQRAKNASGEKAKMYHWCANMKSGKK